MSISLLGRARRVPASTSSVILAGVMGALAPDFDMSYFYLLDHRQTHHHKYITHWPILWLLLSAAAVIGFRFLGNSRVAFLSLVFCFGGVLHVILDSFVGDIWWFAPFIDKPYAMFTVQAVFKPWWLNFILHWSFVAELVICMWALLLYRRRSNPALKGNAEKHGAQ